MNEVHDLKLVRRSGLEPPINREGKRSKASAYVNLDYRLTLNYLMMKVRIMVQTPEPCAPLSCGSRRPFVEEGGLEPPRCLQAIR